MKHFIETYHFDLLEKKNCCDKMRIVYNFFFRITRGSYASFLQSDALISKTNFDTFLGYLN